jgi:hypothetical protein
MIFLREKLQIINECNSVGKTQMVKIELIGNIEKIDRKDKNENCWGFNDL